MLFFLLLFSSHVYAVSILAKDDGRIFVTIKNDHPCFYLSENEPIYYIKLVSETNHDTYTYLHKTGEEKHGFSENSCIIMNNHVGFSYNTPLSVYIGGYNNVYTQTSPTNIQGNRSASHLYHTTNFCILKSQTEKTRLVKARQSHFWETGSQFKCTNQDWIPK